MPLFVTISICLWYFLRCLNDVKICVLQNTEYTGTIFFLAQNSLDLYHDTENGLTEKKVVPKDTSVSRIPLTEYLCLLFWMIFVTATFVIYLIWDRLYAEFQSFIITLFIFIGYFTSPAVSHTPKTIALSSSNLPPLSSCK